MWNLGRLLAHVKRERTKQEAVTPHSEEESEEHSPPVVLEDRYPFKVKVRMIIRRDIRTLFGVVYSNQRGFFLDRDMTAQIHAYADWLEYPKRDFRMRTDFHSASVNAAVVSLDGFYLYTGSEDRSVCIWNLISYGHIHSLMHDSDVICLACHSGTLASGTRGSRIWVWNAHTHELDLTLEGHRRGVYCVDFNHDGSMLVSGSSDNSLRVWSMSHGHCLSVLRGHNAAVNSVRFLEECVLSGSDDGSVREWDPCEGSEMSSTRNRITDGVFEVDVNCDHSLLACMDGLGCTVFSYPKLTFVKRLAVPAYVGRFHPLNPQWLALSGSNRLSVSIYNIRTGVCIRRLSTESMSNYSRQYRSIPVRCLCFSPNGQRLIAVSQDPTLVDWDVSDLKNVPPSTLNRNQEKRTNTRETSLGFPLS